MLVYLNGDFIPAHQARISPFDRGFLFADGVYEVIRSIAMPTAPSGRTLIGLHRHARRLMRSLGNLKIQPPSDLTDFPSFCHGLLDRADLSDALIYLQVTRGTPDFSGPGPLRSHLPQPGLTPTVFAFARPAAAIDLSTPSPITKHSITCDDLRWHRCDIKSVALLGNVLAAMEAHDAGVDEPILIRTDTRGRRLVSEGALTNVMIVPRSAANTVIVPDGANVSMLPGITREILLDLDASLVVRDCLESELLDASEVLLLGTTAMVTSVVQLNGRPVGSGTPGPMARKLLGQLQHAVLSGAHDILPR
jgi:D-alanine transaminase